MELYTYRYPRASSMPRTPYSVPRLQGCEQSSCEDPYHSSPGAYLGHPPSQVDFATLVGPAACPRNQPTMYVSGVEACVPHPGEGPEEESQIVMCMDPGWVKTRMEGEGEMVEPEASIAGIGVLLIERRKRSSRHDTRLVPLLNISACVLLSSLQRHAIKVSTCILLPDGVRPERSSLGGRTVCPGGVSGARDWQRGG